MVSASLALACAGPPGTAPEREAEPVEPVAVEPLDREPVVVEPLDREPVEPTAPTEADEDPELALARASIVEGRVSPEALALLAASTRPEHRRATRLLETIDRKAPSPILVIEPPPRPDPAEPEPVVVEPVRVEPTPVAVPSEPPSAAQAELPREPSPTPAEPDAPTDEADDDQRIDPIDPRAYSSDAAIVAWIRDDPRVDLEPESATRDEPPRDPFAGLVAIDEPDILIPIDWQAETPRVILTRLELSTAAERARIEVVGSGSVPVRVQPLAAHFVRVRLEGAGAVPNFIAARPGDERVAVRAIRRGRGAVELDVELAAAITLLSVTPLANGCALEFGPAPAHNPGP